MKRLSYFLAMVSICGALLARETIDWQRAQELHRRSQRGEKLSPDDQAYLDKAKDARKKRGKHAPISSSDRPESAAHLTPLTELGDHDYKGEKGGLYGGGRNDPPAELKKLVQNQTAKIQPLDKDGKPAASGKVVLLSLGMSNTTQEFSRFKQLADRDPSRAAHLMIVDGAQGGKDARITSEESAPFWTVVDERLAKAGVSRAQVQVIWLKQAVAGGAEIDQLEQYLEKNVHIAQKRFPNLRFIYFSSRIYAGYATTHLNPEPFAYEGAFSVRRLLLKQEQGDTQLNFDPAKGEVKAPLLLWGPYLWADGETPRKSGGLVWKRDDFGPDGTHPSDSGRQKVAEQLLAFFKNDSNARKWFLK